MTAEELARAESFLTAEELAELHSLAVIDKAQRIWVPLAGPQTMAYESKADIVGFGGAAGGGKTDLALGKALSQHRVAFVVRKNGTEHVGMVDRFAGLLGTRDGYSSKDGVWRDAGPRKVQIEFGSLPNPKDEEKYRGRPHDLLVFDEATSLMRYQVEFLMAWNRTTTPGQHCQTLLTFNPPTSAEGRWVVEYFAPWLDDKHPNPAQPGELRWFATIDGVQTEVADGTPFMHAGELITPKSRTFIPSRVTDNPYLVGTNYMSTLQALPEPLRSQMLYGDFKAGVTDDAMQIIPTAWVDAAMARWKPRAPRGDMLSMGVDVARGGKDNTVIATRHRTEFNDWWFDNLLVEPGAQTPDGPVVAGLVVGRRRDSAPIHIDVIGVGGSPYDTLNSMGLQVLGVNMAEGTPRTDVSGRLHFRNLRAWMWWNLRELLDPARDTGVALPPDKALAKELCAPRWELSGVVITLESRDDIVKRVGYSPDRATAVCLAAIETPKLAVRRAAADARKAVEYDPIAQMTAAYEDYIPPELR